MFSLPSAKEIVKNHRQLFKNTNHKTAILQKNDMYFFRETKESPRIPCACISENDTLNVFMKAFHQHSVVVILNDDSEPIGYLTATQMIQFLHQAYEQLKAFYETVNETIDASVTVINKNELVCTWTEGAERLFSIKKQDIIGQPITDFFDRKKLEILQSLHRGKNITDHQHQPRSDLFVLINSNPVYFNKQIIGAVVSETDITNQIVLNEKLFTMSTEVHRLEQEVAKYKDSIDPFHTIKGKSTAIQKTIHFAKKVCSVKSTVLILGESGVGKEVFAKAIHETSEHRNAPLISINCGAIPPSLFESELFGYERGAFSGANHKGKKGKIELAMGGTLFLDEIGEMPLDMQVKLLRVLQERKFYRVGGEKEIETDFRIIAATNRDLQQLMKSGQFREDLYYRLNVVSIHIPPLRKRREDIIELVHYFLNDFSISYQRPIQKFPQEVMHELLHYDWPGNIRELRNIAERLVVFTTDGVIKKDYLPFYGNSTNNEDDQVATASLHTQKENLETEGTILPLQTEMDQHEKKVIERALHKLNGNKLECAKQLGITRATLYNRLKRLGIK